MFNGALNSLLANSGDDIIKSVAKNYADDIAKASIKTTKNKAANIFDSLGITSALDNDLPIYHGTSQENANSILKNGLMFTPEGRNNLTGMGNFGVSTSIDPEVALKYGSAYGNKNILKGVVPKGNKVITIDSAGNGVDDLLSYDQLKKLQDSGYSAVIDKSVGQENEVRLLKDFLKTNNVSDIPEAAKQYLQPQNNGRLMAVHNLSPDKLAFSDELGGMAMPSIGVVDPNVGVIDGYGDITLVGGKNLIDPKLPGNRGRVFPNDMYSPRYPGTKDIINKQSEQELVKKFAASGIDKYGYDLNDMKYFGDQKPVMQLFGKEKGVDFDKLSFKEQQVLRDGDEYRTFVNDLKKNLVEARKFTMWDSNKGREKLFDLNAQNALKLMRKESAIGGENFNYGLGNIRAATTKPFSSIDEIANSSNRLVSNKDFEKVKNDMETKFYGIIDEMSKFRNDTSSYTSTDSIIDSIGDYIKGAPDAFDYGYKTKPSASVLKKLDQLKDELANMATEYFEAKPNRVVGLNEFSAAVVPKNTEQYVRDILQKNGITNLVEYDAAVENARQLALQNLKDLMF